MKKFLFKIQINATPQHVWETMIHPETYKQWTNVSWPGSMYEGTWKKGENLRFVSPGGGGTLANVTDFEPYSFISANHIAVINKDGSEDSTSEMAKRWVGTTESYTFTPKDGGTELQTEMHLDPEWEKMFAADLPKAMEKLKELSEEELVAS